MPWLGKLFKWTDATGASGGGVATAGAGSATAAGATITAGAAGARTTGAAGAGANTSDGLSGEVGASPDGEVNGRGTIVRALTVGGGMARLAAGAGRDRGTSNKAN